MAGIAGLILRDDTITAGLVQTLEHLRALQGAQGQIASNFQMHAGGSPNVSFGTLAPRIDSATWYLVGVALAGRANAINASEFYTSIKRVADCLDALEYNGRHLIYIPTGGNWADEYVTDGYILYDQVLRAWGMQLVGELYERADWSEKARRIADAIATRYAPRDPARARHPIAAFSPVRVHDVFDLAASSLLALSNVAPSLAELSLDWIDETFISRGALPPAFYPVIGETHRDWEALRAYHLHGFRNTPHEYHNGGIWPIWLGWLALALSARRRNDSRTRLRASLTAALDAHPAFAFEEYLHGVTLAPGGTAQMAYTATGLVFTRLAATPEALQLFGA